MLIRDWLRESRERLITAGLTPRAAGFEANLLLSNATGLSRQQLITRDNEPLSSLAASLAYRWLSQRISGQPVAYLLGKQAFWDHDFMVSPWTLIPREDTETLIRVVKNLPLPTALRALDLATGSGIIAITLQAEFPEWRVEASDISPTALRTAQINAQRLSTTPIATHLSDWFSDIPDGRRYNLIVSNPPYVERDHPLMQVGDVRFEPDRALMDGSEDGLAAIKHLITHAPAWLQPDGWLVLEHGYAQAPAVQQLFADAGYREISTHKDYGDNPRITIGQIG